VESSAEPIEKIATHAGFRDPERMRRASYAPSASLPKRFAALPNSPTPDIGTCDTECVRRIEQSMAVMRGLVPRIHVLVRRAGNVDADGTLPRLRFQGVRPGSVRGRLRVTGG
jgi:hypothetical protein